MKTLLKIALFLMVQCVWAQSAAPLWKAFYQNQQSEKVYAHLNNVLYQPSETVYYKLYVTSAANRPTVQSDYVYVDIFDASNKKVAEQCYMIEQGGAAGSYTIGKDMPAGMYSLKAYTKLQLQLGEAPFEKHFFVQKVIAPRVLMTLDFRKKGYGAGDVCEADFTLKSNDNQPVRKQKVDFEIFIDGKNINTLQAVTDAEGEAVLTFSLPADLKSNDGIINVKVDYDNQKESITRAIPINLNFADLQFLPEGGNYIVNQPSNVFFIAKNEFGKPLDVSGYIEDRDGKKVQNFTSFYDGMGKVTFTPQSGKQYFAVITAPFDSKQKYALPAALARGYGLSVTSNPENILLNVYAPEKASCEVLIRNQDKVYQSVSLNAVQGANALTVASGDLPMGTYAVSLVVSGQIVAERLVFVNYKDGLTIDMQTDKQQYMPREKVQATIMTKDKNNRPVASNLSVSVADEKILSYIDDKQHNLLTWMFFGFEMKGTVNEPRFYFDEKEPLDKRLTALDLLLNTHGWRRFNQDEINKFDGKPVMAIAEKSSDVEGFVLTQAGKPVSLKVYLMSDTGKVYETKSDANGYFKFMRTHFEKSAWLIVESKKNRDYIIKNSIAHLDEILGLRDALKVSALDYKTFKSIIKPATAVEIMQQQAAEAGYFDLDNDDNLLEDVVVIGYGNVSRKVSTGSYITVYSTTVTQSLSGVMAGVQIQTGTGQPGATGNIRIRGTGSIYGPGPLYVIDGIPYPDNEQNSIFSALTPQMIESITVLKDANATAIYGSRAAQGVIIITTKKGSSGKGILLGDTYHYTMQNINRSTTKTLNTPAAFYAPVYKTTVTEEKTDFRNCLYWNAVVQTNAQGRATFEFYNSDETSTFSILAEGTSYKGDLGTKKYSYVVKEPVETDVKIPLYTTQEDVVRIPLRVKNNSNSPVTINAVLAKSEFFEVANENQTVELGSNASATLYFSLKALKAGNKLPLKLKISTDTYATTIKKTIDIYGKGFPMSVSFSGTKSATQSFSIYNAKPNTIQSELKFIVNPYNELSNGLEAMLREPGGCFEQVSSTNYPNIMALQLLSAKGMDENMKQKALSFLNTGYQKLKNYESKNGGFEWYGGNPGHEALTAYGLLQFSEMKDFIAVDKDLVKRSVDWLYSRKDNKGGYQQNKGKYGFTSIPYEVNNAYIVYVISEIGEKNIDKEYQSALAEALKSRDVYRTALMALAAHNLNDLVSYKKLLDNIKADLKGKEYAKVEVANTIVRSYGLSKSVEWASLYALALMKEGKMSEELLNVMDFIQSSKKVGGFGSTQATALALKAVTTFSKGIRSNVNQPQISAALNNTAQATAFDAGGNITTNTTGGIKAGENTVSVTIGSDQMVPYLFYVNYLSSLPNNSPQCELELKTSLAQSKLKVSETTRLKVEFTNKTKKVVQNPLVRIGIPGGTSPEPWQLKELVDKNIVDYYEIFGSELVLYFREMDALETKTINIDLKAQIPGSYEGIASSAYLYYNNEHKNWNGGLTVDISE